MESFDIDVNHLAFELMQLVVAYLLAMPIGWEREVHGSGAGLRTFPLVAVGSCAYLMLGLEMLSGSEPHARVLYGLMTGIGFIGGGSILKSKASVSGTASAASIWNTGAIGAAVAWQRLDLAILLSLVNVATLFLTRPLKRAARSERDEDDVY